MKKAIFLLLFLILTLTFISCSDSVTTVPSVTTLPSVTTTAFPTSAVTTTGFTTTEMTDITSTMTTVTTESLSLEDFVAVLDRGLVAIAAMMAENVPTDLANTPAYRPGWIELNEKIDDSILYPEDFHAIYDSQVLNSNLYELYYAYEFHEPIIEAVRSALLEHPEMEFGIPIAIDIDGFAPIMATFAFGDDGFILIILEQIAEDYSRTVYAYRMGFASEQFVFDILEYTYIYFEREYECFVYFSYIEDDRFLYIYIFEGDYEFVTISDLTGEINRVSAIQDIGIGGNVAYQIWNDPMTMQQTAIKYIGTPSAEERVKTWEYYDFHNEHGIYFKYSVPDIDDPENVSMWWSLLDAEGWDYVIEGNTDDGKCLLYIDGEPMYSEENSFYVRCYLDYITSLYLIILRPADFFTADVINLSAFGMQFNYTEFSPEFLASMRLQADEERSVKQMYGDVDLLGPNVTIELLQFFPQELMDLIYK